MLFKKPTYIRRLEEKLDESLREYMHHELSARKSTAMAAFYQEQVTWLKAEIKRERPAPTKRPYTTTTPPT